MDKIDQHDIVTLLSQINFNLTRIANTLEAENKMIKEISGEK